MSDKKQAVFIGALGVALVASWGWFYFAQQRTDAQLAMLMTKAASAPASQVGRPAADPYKDEAVKNTLRKHAAEIQKLWVAYLDRNPARTEGVIETDWQIGADGEVVEAGVVHSEFDDRELNEGIAKVLRGIKYPPPPMGMRTYVSHKFNLKKD